MQRTAFVIAAALLGASIAYAGETPSPAGAKAYFIDLKDGDSVTSPVAMRFGLSGMKIASAGDHTPNTGHFHLIIDDTLTGDALNQPIPSDGRHIHFGQGQMSAVVPLPKGKHTLQLLMGDWKHVPHDPPVMSERITVTVQ